ncbi:hypothetical protein ACKEUS_03790, partial [Yersinia enterocolitica]
NRAHKETGYMAAIPERYFQEKTLGLLGASIYGGSSHQGRLFLQREYGVFMIYLFSPLRALCQQSEHSFWSAFFMSIFLLQCKSQEYRCETFTLA